MKICPVGAE